MKSSVRTYLDLVRLPNLFTAAADILGGHLYVQGCVPDYGILLRLVVGSMCLYAGGVALNDVCDVAEDARERPGRPIPRGDITRPQALVFSLGLLIIGGGLTASTSSRAALLTLMLIGSIILYDALLKRTIAAPAIMGLCRALNLMLGMNPSNVIDSSVLVPAALMWLYVASVTFFARRETGASSKERLLTGTMGLLIAVLGLLVVHEPGATAINARSVVVVLVAVFVLDRGLGAVRHPEPKNIQGAVKSFVLFIIVFDALLAAANVGLMGGVLISLLIIPAMAAARLFRVT